MPTKTRSRGKWLLSMFAVPMVLAAGLAGAEPWLERSETVGQSWDDLPFLGPPQRRMQRQPRSPQTTRALEARRELQRELHRAPEVNRAPNSTPTVNVFPSPRLPSVALRPVPEQTVPRPVPEQTVPRPVPEQVVSRPSPERVVPRPLPEKRIAAVRTRDVEVEQELQRELQRGRPASAVPSLTEPLACAERLARVARYSPLPSRTGPGGCGASDLVRLDHILMPDRTSVALNPAPQIRCSMAEHVAQWVREDVGPAAVAELGAPLLSITDNDAYDCRPRNNIKGAQLSEHGKGNALDITAIRLRNGGVFTLTDQLVTKLFRDKIRAAACGRFMTVLGPGSDAYHNDHVHLDMAERKRNVQVCQWNIRETLVASRSEPQAPEPALVASAPPVRIAPPVIEPPPSAMRESPPVRSEPEAPANTAGPSTVGASPSVQRESEQPAAAAPSNVAAAPPEPAIAPAAPVAVPPPAVEVSPPLPLRKPEALQTRSLAHARMEMDIERDWRWERLPLRSYNRRTAPVRRRGAPSEAE